MTRISLHFLDKTVLKFTKHHCSNIFSLFIITKNNGKIEKCLPDFFNLRSMPCACVHVTHENTRFIAELQCTR